MDANIHNHINFPVTTEEKVEYEASKKALWLETAKRAYKAQQLRKMYEKEEKELLESLKSFSLDQSTSHGNFAFIKAVRQGSVDYSAIPELEGVDLNKYRKESSSVWKLEYLGGNE